MENVPANQVNQDRAIAWYYVFKIAPICAGTFAVYLGYQLFILGVTGQASLSIESRTVNGQLLNAAPGLFFALGGLLTIIIASWKGVKIHFSKDAKSL